MILLVPPLEGSPSVLPHVSTSAVPEEGAEQYVALAIEATRLRPRRTTGGTEHSYIWTTEHHLTAAAEASAETSVSLQVTIPDLVDKWRVVTEAKPPSNYRSHTVPVLGLL